MKKLVAVLAVASLMAVGAIAYAHGSGGRCCGQMAEPGYGAHIMGPGYGGHMMGQGYGGHMMGKGGTGYGYDQKFLNETVEQRIYNAFFLKSSFLFLFLNIHYK